MGRPRRWNTVECGRASRYAAFGAFTSLYGRNHLHMPRVVMQLTVGAAMVVAVVGGVLVGTLSSAVHAVGDVVPAVLVTSASVLFSVVVGGLGILVRGSADARPSRIRLNRSWLPVRAAVAVMAAGAMSVALGIGHPYWAMVAAVAPLTIRDVAGQLTRATQRIAGTLLGLVPAALLLALDLRGLVLVLVVAALQVVTELFIGRNYALALLFITPLAMLMGQTAVRIPPGQLLFDRGVETVLGSLVGVALLLLVHRLESRRVRDGAA